ncbi:MAG TPA: VOC family protein [Burkholderiaceae bacterium]|nr:VOC family protein [Burkholderiaceae bacterium]
MSHHLRIARPVRDLQRTATMYRRGLRLHPLGSFQDHAGFDGVMLGVPDAAYHFEFTRGPEPAVPASSPEDLVVLYVPEPHEWAVLCRNMLAAGFRAVASFNPYWDVRGRTFEDADGHRIVLECARWSP